MEQRLYTQRNYVILVPRHHLTNPTENQKRKQAISEKSEPKLLQTNNAIRITVGSFSHPKEAKNKSFFLNNILIHTCCHRIPDLCMFTEIWPKIFVNILLQVLLHKLNQFP